MSQLRRYLCGQSWRSGGGFWWGRAVHGMNSMHPLCKGIIFFFDFSQRGALFALVLNAVQNGVDLFVFIFLHFLCFFYTPTTGLRA